MNFSEWFYPGIVDRFIKSSRQKGDTLCQIESKTWADLAIWACVPPALVNCTLILWHNWHNDRAVQMLCAHVLDYWALGHLVRHVNSAVRCFDFVRLCDSVSAMTLLTLELDERVSITHQMCNLHVALLMLPKREVNFDYFSPVSCRG